VSASEPGRLADPGHPAGRSLQRSTSHILAARIEEQVAVTVGHDRTNVTNQREMNFADYR
jgi:hypothetical protein